MRLVDAVSEATLRVKLAGNKSPSDLNEAAVFDLFMLYLKTVRGTARECVTCAD